MKKKIFDITLVIIFFPILVPLIILIIFLSLIFNNSPIFFYQYRGGFKNKKIKIIKFRTIDKNNNINYYSNILRYFKIDELPQIINVIKGDISLVGPRPLIYEYKKLYKKRYLRRFDVMPGITGWAQINSNSKTSWSKRFELDLWYVDNYNFFLDFKILLLTIKKIGLLFFNKNKTSKPIKNFNG